MKRLTSFVRFAPIVAAALGLHAGARAGGPDVGVSVQISQPGVYGRVDIGRFPQPAVVLPQPVIVAPRPMPQPPPGVVLMTPPPAPQPLYMWVPPGHRKNWRKHCARYNACGVPVYFVRDDWYAHQVQPRAGVGAVQHLLERLAVVGVGRRDLRLADQLVARVRVGVHLVAVEALAVLLGPARVAVGVLQPLGIPALGPCGLR